MIRVHTMKIGDLICWGVREPDEWKDTSLNASMAEFGWILPVTIDSAGVVIMGQDRVDAAKRAGHAVCPCLFKEFLSEAQCAALAVAEYLLDSVPWDRDGVSFVEDLLRRVEITMEGASDGK